MNTKNNGGPAFPVAFRMNDKQVILEDGISVRDYFAGQALARIPDLLTVNGKNKSVTNIVDWSYQIADAMLAARKEASK